MLIDFKNFVVKLVSSNEQLVKNSEKISAIEAQIADLVTKQEYTSKLIERLIANTSNHRSSSNRRSESNPNRQRSNETTKTKKDPNSFVLQMFQTNTTPQREYVR